MLSSLFSAVSGLDANQTAMDGIGNNIANVNTVGYKAGTTEFESLFSQTLAGASAATTTLGGVNPEQVGLGVGIAGTSTNFTEGTTEQTGQPLNVSIQGNGFLVTSQAGQTLYTRAGQLQLDANGNLVEPNGAFVQGWQATNGTVNTGGALGNLTIPTTGASVPGAVTTSVNLNGNIALVAGQPPSVPVTVYDAVGAPSVLTLQFVQGAGGAWSARASNGTTAGGALSYGAATPLAFNGDGSSGQPTISVTDNAGRTYTLNVANLSANAMHASVAASNQNGSAPGTLLSYNIGPSGALNGVFSNGTSRVLGQIALASFANDNGLSAVGDTAYAATANSGLAQRRSRPGVHQPHHLPARLRGQREDDHHLRSSSVGPDQHEELSDATSGVAPPTTQVRRAPRRYHPHAGPRKGHSTASTGRSRTP